MTHTKDIMHSGVECVGEHDTLQTAARRMRELGVGAMPICGDDDRLHGIITDRDIVVKCVADGKDPTDVTAAELAQGKPFYIDSEADVRDALTLMEEHQIRRLPVVENHRLVGMISEADVARNLPENAVGHFVEAISKQQARSG
ncbi:CBS domain-containing protein [Saccharomonospora piscinae]|uniref:CBS domain-containing protein n=1 Tax=Saccharomonospora piscinae TaxID=687388 RepID=A0A1V9ACH6_SACPI|nr:CBS domain-containing protein [Saccharomonospora piscinae]OQO94829.1 CBS domain-containing protein [Saccharomonospora piscinae]TLW94455.1 CBS domain-containing protein [Saccharomonospora piscinae]